MRFCAGLLFATLVGCPAAAQPGAPPIGILVAAGDISTCGGKEWHRYANRTAKIIRDIREEASQAQAAIPIYVLALGDLAYPKGTKAQFACFADRWSGFEDILLPVPGNHEYLSPDGKPYFEHFSNNTFVNQTGTGKGYFSVNFPRTDGPWQIIGLNDNFERNAKYKSDAEAQLKWLDEVLRIAHKANPPTCVLALWHAPLLSSGRHGHDYDVSPKAPLTKARPMQRAFRTLYRHGASVVLTGHDHNYEQFSPHDADGKAAQDGIRSFVVGTGGSLLTEDHYENRAPNSEGLFGRSKGVQGVLKIELFEDRYAWQFLSIDPKKKLPLEITSSGCAKRKVP